RLASWQRSTYKVVKIHYAFIAGENDGEADVHAVCDALEGRRLMAHVNIVRYNPHDPRRHGVESSEEDIRRNAAIFQSRLRTRSSGGTLRSSRPAYPTPASGSSRGSATTCRPGAGCFSRRRGRRPA